MNPCVIALAVTLATFMVVLDTTIANAALPHIAGSLSAGQDESTWVLASYLVSNAIVLPLSGWLHPALVRRTFCGHANMLSYIDCFWFLGFAIMLMIPAVFLKKTRPGGGMAVH